MFFMSSPEAAQDDRVCDRLEQLEKKYLPFWKKYLPYHL